MPFFFSVFARWHEIRRGTNSDQGAAHLDEARNRKSVCLLNTEQCIWTWIIQLYLNVFFSFFCLELVWYHNADRSLLCSSRCVKIVSMLWEPSKSKNKLELFLICRVCFSLLLLTALQQLKTMHYLCVCDFSPHLSMKKDGFMSKRFMVVPCLFIRRDAEME